MRGESIHYKKLSETLEKRAKGLWELSEQGKDHGRTKVGLNQMWSFKKPRINPSQWQSALWGEQRSKAKSLYKMFIFGGLCGLVFGRALNPTRPTMELKQKAGGRKLAAACPTPAPPSRLGPALPSRWVTASAVSAPGTP